MTKAQSWWFTGWDIVVMIFLNSLLSFCLSLFIYLFVYLFMSPFLSFFLSFFLSIFLSFFLTFFLFFLTIVFLSLFLSFFLTFFLSFFLNSFLSLISFLPSFLYFFYFCSSNGLFYFRLFVFIISHFWNNFNFSEHCYYCLHTSRTWHCWTERRGCHRDVRRRYVRNLRLFVLLSPFLSNL